VSSQPLSFGALDGLAFAAARGRLAGARGITPTIAGELGPFIELYQLGEAGLITTPGRASWLTLDGTRPFYEALISNRRRWVCPKSHRAGFFRTEPVEPADESPWVEFGIDTQRAAESAGFTRSTAQQFVGALGELASNIYEHSSKPASGLVAFKAEAGRFEFVVCDRGVGILETLRSCPEHSGLTDHGDALRLALTEGVSRFGSDKNRGKGFRPLFLGLADLWGSLRFRSGDHALIIDGQSPSLTSATTSQKAPISGFLVSVRCQLGPARVSSTG
jgi:anti-sigma regulatory factor (Ser/Thr protein kinase)